MKVYLSRLRPLFLGYTVNEPIIYFNLIIGSFYKLLRLLIIDYHLLASNLRAKSFD